MNYTFLLEYESYEQMVNSIWNKTGHDLKKTREILQKIADQDPDAYLDAVNTGKKSTARSIVRGVAAQKGTKEYLDAAEKLGSETDKVVSDSERFLGKSSKQASSASKKATNAASKAPLINFEKDSANKIQKVVDKAKGKSSEALGQAKGIKKELLQKKGDVSRIGKVLDVTNQGALEATLHGKRIPFNKAEIEKVINNKMAKLERTVDPVKAESLGRQIERLSAKLGLSDKVEQLRSRVRNILSKFENTSITNNEVFSNARKAVGADIARGQNRALSAKLAERLNGMTPVASKPTVMQTIRGWLPKVTKIFKR